MSSLIIISSFKFVDDKNLANSYEGDPTEYLQKALDTEATETKKDKMIINESKCNIITFNFSKKNFSPIGLKLNDQILNHCNYIKLLGVIISEDLKWSKNTSYIVKKVNSKFFMLNKLKQFGFNENELLTAWKVMVRPVMEYAAPLWHSGLSSGDTQKLENLQKRALAIVLGTVYIDNRRYFKVHNIGVNNKTALEHCNLESLEDRRVKTHIEICIRNSQK